MKTEKYITTLLKESITTGDIELTRPALTGLSRAVNKLIFMDLVAVQPTTRPTATVYGLSYRNEDGNRTFNTGATYTGSAGDRSGITDAALATPYTAKDLIKYNDVVYEVVADGALSGADLDTAIFDAVVSGSIRFFSDAAATEQFEDPDAVISESSFDLRRWSVTTGTRKTKTPITLELLQDIESNGMDAEAIIDDMLATIVSEEINKDIVQKLITVSTRYKTEQIQNAVFDATGFTDNEAPAGARRLFQHITEMASRVSFGTSFDATYLLVSSRVFGYLAGSGWIKANAGDDLLYDGVTVTGLKVYQDLTTPIDYAIVGCKHVSDGIEHTGSLFYTPYTDIDLTGEYKVVVDPSSLQPSVMLMSRYGLGVNPYTTQLDATDAEKRSVKADDWARLVGQSKLSYMIGVKLPKLV